MMNTIFHSERIEPWHTVKLKTGIIGIVTRITINPQGHGKFYHIAADKLHCVPRDEIEGVIKNPKPSLNPQKEAS